MGEECKGAATTAEIRVDALKSSTDENVRETMESTQCYTLQCASRSEATVLSGGEKSTPPSENNQKLVVLRV